MFLVLRHWLVQGSGVAGILRSLEHGKWGVGQQQWPYYHSLLLLVRDRLENVIRHLMLFITDQMLADMKAATTYGTTDQ